MVDELIQCLSFEIKGLDEFFIEGIAKLPSVSIQQLVVNTPELLKNNRCAVYNRDPVPSLGPIAPDSPEYKDYYNDSQHHFDHPGASMFPHQMKHNDLTLQFWISGMFSSR